MNNFFTKNKNYRKQTYISKNSMLMNTFLYEK